MVDVIRIQAQQTMVNYRTPTSFLIRETYPLPPYSTVVGMIHSVCGFDSWHPMLISVQGRSQGVTSDLFIRYSFANKAWRKDKDGKPRKCYATFDAGGKLIGVSRGISHMELLCDVELILHIKPERDEDFESVLTGLRNPRIFPSLGRHEDLLDITSIDVVSVESREKVKLNCGMFIPVSFLTEKSNRNLPGTIYLLHKEYEIIQNQRRWKDLIETRYLGGEYYNDNYLYDFTADEDGFPVALA